MKNHSPHITVAVHGGEFHADDVFAFASLRMLAGGSKQISLIRTRDEVIIRNADYVADVGGIYDPEKNRFDHHQIGGAGERPNKIPYASFGLVWKKFGEMISDSDEIAEIVDQRLVQSIDAIDNGVSIAKETVAGIRPYDISSIIGAMNPTWNERAEDDGGDGIFLEAADLAGDILAREIKSARSELDGEKFAVEAYEKSDDKRVVVMERKYPFEKILSRMPEPLYAVYPKDGNWRVKAVRGDVNSFENRKNLPASWAGKRGTELSAVTGVPGGIFCHNKLFTAHAETKAAAIAMAKIAVES